MNDPGKHARHWPHNPYEVASRQKKAFLLASRLHQFKITADEAALMTPKQWRELATAANAKPPNSKETFDMVLEALRSMERVPEQSAEESFRRCKS